MLRKLLRWLFRVVMLAAVVLLIAAIDDYLTHRVEPGSVLVLTLRGAIVERGTALAALVNARRTPLNVVRRALERAARDDRIVGLGVKVIDPEMEFAQAQELCALIREFRSHGKWTTAYLETAGEFESGNLPYLVAAAASEVSMMPQGELDLMGVGVREVFARGALDRLKIKPNFAAIGEYKDAANVFTEKDFTPAQREQDDALVADLFDQLVTATARSRNLPRDTVRRLIDQAPLDPAAGLKARLVDRLEYEDQFKERLKHYQGSEHALVEYADYARPRLLPRLRPPDRIAVVYASGAIERGSGGFDPVLSPGGDAVGSDDIADAFKTAREDDSVRAVVFRIDSPGGSVIGSELIRRQVELTAKVKPVVVSMSGYAASGGYWVATGGAKLFAEPGTVTGSIGVLGGKFNVAEAAGALGVNTGAVTRGANVEMFDAFTDFSPEQAKMFREQLLGNTYQYFVSLVARDRHMTVAEVDKIARGRVWTGAQALKLKLVDALGGLREAIAEARGLAKVPAEQHLEMLELPVPPGLLQQILSGQVGAEGALYRAGPRALGPFLRMLALSLAHRGLFGAAYCPVVPLI